MVPWGGKIRHNQDEIDVAQTGIKISGRHAAREITDAWITMNFGRIDRSAE
jgi:hypothetical protein